MENQIQERLKKWTFIDASLVIAAITAFIYFSSYEYDKGYCSHFQIPDYLIDPSINSILKFSTVILLISLNFGNVFGFTFSWLKNIDNHPKKHTRFLLRLNLYLFILLIFLFFSFPLTWYNFLIFIAFAAIVNFANWGLGALLSIRSKNPIEQGINTMEQSQTTFSVWSRLENVYGSKYTRAFLLIILFPLFANLIGIGEALKQEDFYLLNGKPNTIVVRKFGENLICIRINPKNHIITDTIFVYKINDKDPIQLNQRHIGPLTR